MTLSGVQQTKERISVYVLNDDLRLTQPIRAAHPFDEIPLYICREPSTNQLLFMQNKPNVKDAQINVTSYMKSKYEKLDTWLSGKNKANSNPIKPCPERSRMGQFLQKAKMDVNLYDIKDYRKKDNFLVRINKPNSNPIFSKPKMSANVYVIEDYENKTAFRPQKNKPKQSQFPKGPGKKWILFEQSYILASNRLHRKICSINNVQVRPYMKEVAYESSNETPYIS